MDITNQIKWEKSNESVQKMNDKNDKQQQIATNKNQKKNK